MQGTQVQNLVWEPRSPMPQSNQAHSPQLLSPGVLRKIPHNSPNPTCSLKVAVKPWGATNHICKNSLLPFSYKQWSHSLNDHSNEKRRTNIWIHLFYTQVTPEEFFMILILEMRWETKTFFVCERKEGRMSHLRNFCYKISSNMKQISQGQKCPVKCLTNESQRWCFVGFQN